MVLEKRFKTVGKVLFLCRGVNFGHVGECKETLCVNVIDFGNGGHIMHQKYNVQILDAVHQTNGQLTSKEECYLEQDVLFGCFH
eukprot:13132359-Ditylum_brightwellii.AAC.1